MRIIPCKQGHDAGYFGNGQCKECRRISARAYHEQLKALKGPPKPGERGSGVCERGHVNPKRNMDRACIECKLELQRQRRKINPVRKFDTKYNRGTKRVCRRGHPNVVGKNCLECRKQKRRERDALPENRKKNRESYDRWRVANPKKVHEASRKWQMANPERMQVIRVARTSAQKNAPGRLTDSEWKAILKKYKHKCAYCGVKLTNKKNSPDQVTQDHVVPLQGEDARGTNYAFNVVPACRKCNTSKNNRVLPDVQFSLFDQLVS